MSGGGGVKREYLEANTKNLVGGGGRRGALQIHYSTRERKNKTPHSRAIDILPVFFEPKRSPTHSPFNYHILPTLSVASNPPLCYLHNWSVRKSSANRVGFFPPINFTPLSLLTILPSLRLSHLTPFHCSRFAKVKPTELLYFFFFVSSNKKWPWIPPIPHI